MIIHAFFTEQALGLVYLEFALTAVVIVLAGRRLTVLGDEIAEVTGLGQVWIGATLVAFATSLPEVVSSATAALQPTRETINLAFGNVLGSEAFNLVLIAIMDAMHRQGPILAYASRKHILTATFGIVLIGLAGLGLAGPLVAEETLVGMTGAGFSAAVCIAIVGLYLVGMRLIYRQQREADETLPVPDELATDLRERKSAGALYGRFVVMALLVTGAAVVMIGNGDAISTSPIPGLGLVPGRSLVGTLLIALCTSLPEMTVTVAAMRIGARDIALGNVLGSNLMNVVIIPLTSLIAWRAVFVDPNVEPVHLVTAAVGVGMTIPVVIGLKARFKKSFLRLGWGTWLLILAYIAGIYMVWRLGRG